MLVPLDIVERIEIIYGPSSLLYGGYSFYGIINVITKSPEKNENNLFLDYGNFETKEAIFSKSIRKKNFSLLYSLGYYSFEGEHPELPLYELPDGTTWGGKQEGTHKEVSPFFYFYSKYKDFTFHGRFGYRNKDCTHGAYEAKYGGHTVIDRKNFFEISYKKSISANSEFNLRFFSDYYSFFSQHAHEHEEEHPRSEEEEIHSILARNMGYGFETRFSYFFKNHYLTFGFEGRSFDVKQGYSTAHSNESEDHEEGTKILSNHKFKLFYFQDEINLTKNLRFILGGNYLSLTPGKNIALPRFALTYSISEKLNLKLISGDGYRNPSAFEIFYYDIHYIQNPNLKPEEIRNYEINLSYRLNKNTFSQFSIFQSFSKDLIEETHIEVDDEEFHQYQNIGKARAKGFIGSFESRFGFFDFKLNFTYQKGEKEENGKYLELKGVPEKIIKANFSYNGKDFSIGVSSFWQSKVYLSEDHLIQDKNEISPQYLFNINFNYNLIYIVPINLNLKIENLFDEEFYDPTSHNVNIPYYPEMGSKIIFGFDVNF